MIADTLVVIGLATISLGTIQETDGVQECTFWLRNDGLSAVTLHQGYTSCGCTTIQFDKGREIMPGDSTNVVMRFNPRGKGGEFLETGTIVYGKAADSLASENKHRSRVQIAMEGDCVTSEETLLKQFPIRISDHLRLSADRFDLGIMHVGESKERGVVVLHRDKDNQKERLPIIFTADSSLKKGLHHIPYTLTLKEKDRIIKQIVTLDVMIK